MKMKLLIMASVVMACGVSEARLFNHANTRANSSAETMQMKVGENYQVLEFAPGSALLSDGASGSLRSLIDTAKTNGTIDHLYVAAWSDEKFPIGKTKLSKSERNLAKERLAAVDQFVKDEMNVGPISNFNMAENSNWFARLFRTKDAKVKSLFNRAGAPANVAPEQLLTLKAKGGPDRAVVVLRLKPSATTASYRTTPTQAGGGYIGTGLANTRRLDGPAQSDIAINKTGARDSLSATTESATSSETVAQPTTKKVRHAPQNHNSERVYDYNNDSNAKLMRATGDSSFDDNYNGPQSPASNR